MIGTSTLGPPATVLPGRRETRVSDSNDNEVAPAIVADSQSPSDAYIAWQGDSAGHEDVYVARFEQSFPDRHHLQDHLGHFGAEGPGDCR